jgi:hypothetical protein
MSELSVFYKKYVELNLKDYFNIDFPINKLVILLTLALIAASVFISYRQNLEATILKKLLRAEAVGDENAKTASELRLLDNKGAIRLLSSPVGYLKTMVFRTGAGKLSYEEYIAKEKDLKKMPKWERKSAARLDSTFNIETERFYLLPEAVEKAKRVFYKNTTSPLKTVLFSVMIAAVGTAIFFLMPTILSLFKAA